MTSSPKISILMSCFNSEETVQKSINSILQQSYDEFEFLIIGDGGTKKKRQDEIENLSISNVVLEKPVNRKELQGIYNNADYLFIHLNDYPAFRKVLPSKIFELATFGKPIIAGVSGFASEFIKNEVSDSYVFEPCNSKQLVEFLRMDTASNTIVRKEFKLKYRRSNINKLMAESILSYI